MRHNRSFSLLRQTAYFEVLDDKLILTTDEKFSEVTKRLKRSLREKREYFKNHKVQKQPGFEVHHIVPLVWSERVEHFKLLDKWQNMLYIDAFSHAKITQNRSRNVIMQIQEQNITLRDYWDNEVELIYQKNVYYDTKKESVMLHYNDKLLQFSKEL